MIVEVRCYVKEAKAVIAALCAECKETYKLAPVKLTKEERRKRK